MKKDFSPEERLLRLIKGPKKKKEAPKKEETATQIELPEAMSQTGKAPARTASISLPLILKEFNTRALNSILIIVFIGLLSYFIYDIYYTTYHKKEPNFFVKNGKMPEVEEEDILDIQPYSFYSSTIEGRNIFMPQQVETEAVITGPTLEEVSANLSLIGIIAGARPQAIIDDKKSGKSHFLYEGGSIGKAKVKEILEGSVVMEYQGQTFELVL